MKRCSNSNSVRHARRLPESWISNQRRIWTSKVLEGIEDREEREEAANKGLTRIYDGPKGNGGGSCEFGPGKVVARD